MYGYGYPSGGFGYGGSCCGTGWIWIIVVVLIIFFILFCDGNNNRRCCCNN